MRLPLLFPSEVMGVLEDIVPDGWEGCAAADCTECQLVSYLLLAADAV